MNEQIVLEERATEELNQQEFQRVLDQLFIKKKGLLKPYLNLSSITPVQFQRQKKKVKLPLQF